MNLFRFSVAVLVLGFCAVVSASAGSLFHATDPLAARDEWGLLHQSPSVIPTDLERRRYYTRLTYHMQSGRKLSTDPAYVGALQTALRRTGYYCGEIDGVFSAEVTDAIARLQKNYSMRVTGNLTVPVRRALRLP
jgi:hypothetical protein